MAAKFDTDRDWAGYKYDDQLQVCIWHQRKPELMVSESFADEMSRQLSRQIADDVGTTIAMLKKNKYFLERSYYVKDYFFEDRYYFILSFPTDYAGTSMWASWYIKGYDKDMMRAARCYDDMSDKEIVFEIPHSIPKPFLEKKWGYLKEDEPEDYENLVNGDRTKWIKHVQKDVAKYIEEQRKYHENRKYSFEFEIACGYPDVNLVIEFSEEGKANKEKAKKKVDRMFAKFMKDMGEDGIHYYDFVDEEETDNSFTVVIDLGEADTDLFFFDVLKKLHQAKLGISKVSFV